LFDDGFVLAAAFLENIELGQDPLAVDLHVEFRWPAASNTISAKWSRTV